MRYEKRQVRIPGPRLPTVLGQIANSLQSNDWERFSTNDGNHFYYIIGVESFYAEVNGELEFTIWEIPGKPSSSPHQPSPIAEWYLRSQLASRQPDYMRKVRKRIENLGVSSELVNAILKDGANQA